MIEGLQRRDVEIAQRYQGGELLAEIGADYGLTRQRVQQILSEKFGLRRENGGQHKRAEEKRKKLEWRRQKYYLKRYGMVPEKFKRVQAKKTKNGLSPLRCFSQQKSNANIRNIPWKLTFAEWWGIWEQSGKWGKRGRGKSGYCMSRPGDTGAYEIGNVRIVPSPDNNSEYINRYWEEVHNGERYRPSNYGKGSRKTHCKRGHEYTPENTYINPSDGRRHCRVCLRKQWNRADAKRRGTKRKNGAK